MGRIKSPDKSASFTGKFRKGDRVVVAIDPPLTWMPKPRGTVWGAVPLRSGYLVRYRNGQIAGWREDELRPAFGHGLRRLWMAVQTWWKQRKRR